MINRVHQIIPKHLAEELLRLAKIDREWVKWEPLEEGHYKARFSQDTWLLKMCSVGSDGFGLMAMSTWLLDGPKIFRPTQEQAAAMEQIEVRLELHEYAQPYPAILIELPSGPFTSVLCHRSESLLTCCLFNDDHKCDINMTIATDGKPMEVSLQRYDDNCADSAKDAAKALRVAVNSCLALANFGCHAYYLLTKEIQRDREMAAGQSERGAAARKRIKEAIKLVSFDHEVKLHHQSDNHDGRGVASDGREVSSHWRRGHWRVQHHGPRNSLSKMILIKPVLVRADLFVGELSETVTSYKS